MENTAIDSAVGKKKAKQRFQERLLERMIRSKPEFLKECEFRPVLNVKEFQAASRLVYHQYHKKNYVGPNEKDFRLTIYQATQKAHTMVALYKKKYLLATFTFIEDSPLGLPMDKIYKDELDVLRKVGRNLVEIGMLAQNTDLMDHPAINFSQSDRLWILLHLMKAALDHSRSFMKRNMVVACFHPHHAPFYEMLQMKRFSGLRSHEGVQGSPALAYCWDLIRLDETATGFLSSFFGFNNPAYKAAVTKEFRFSFLEFINTFIHLPPA